MHSEKSMDQKLLQLLVCPSCKGPLTYEKEKSELWCHAEKLGYRIENHIPVMLVEEARQLKLEELD